MSHKNRIQIRSVILQKLAFEPAFDTSKTPLTLTPKLNAFRTEAKFDIIPIQETILKNSSSSSLIKSPMKIQLKLSTLNQDPSPLLKNKSCVSSSKIIKALSPLSPSKSQAYQKNYIKTNIPKEKTVNYEDFSSKNNQNQYLTNKSNSVSPKKTNYMKKNMTPNKLDESLPITKSPDKEFVQINGVFRRSNYYIVNSV